MHRQSLAHLALFAILSLGTACGGAQTHAEAPSDTPPSTSDSSASGADGSASKTDTQVPDSALGNANDQKAKTASDPPFKKPESTSAAEDAIISGNALPPSPSTSNASSAPKASKATKAKKPAKTPKKAAQATGG